MKRESILEAFDPKTTADAWHERYPEISKIHVVAALNEVHQFVAKSTLVPSQKDTERLLGLKLGQILLERHSIIKKLKKDSTVAKYWEPYKNTLPKGVVKNVLLEVANEIETGKNYLISPAAGVSNINRRLADLNSEYMKKQPKDEEVHIQPDAVLPDKFVTKNGLMVTGLGILCDLYYLAIVAENMRTVHIEANCMTVPALTLTLAPLGVSFWKWIQTHRE